MGLQRGAINANNNYWGVNTETITSERNLLNSDVQVQNLTNSTTSDLKLNLPVPPVNNKLFTIINSFDSTANFLINNRTLLPGDRYEIAFDSVWIEL